MEISCKKMSTEYFEPSENKKRIIQFYTENIKMNMVFYGYFSAFT